MGAYYEIITKVKPGITGPWQVTGRSKLKFEDRMKLDCEYIQKGTLKEDLQIVFKTIAKVVKKDGAI